METKNNKQSKEELKSLALDVLIFTEGKVNLAETLYYKNFLDYEDVKEVERIYTEIEKLKIETEKLSNELEDNIHTLKTYFPDILKNTQQTEELIASLEERIQNLQNEKSQLYSKFFDYKEKELSTDEISERLAEIYYQIDMAERTIEFLKYGTIDLKRDKNRYNKIKQIFDLDIFEVIEKELGIRIPRNGLVQIKCPLHNETNPSFTIYRDTNSFYCFGCQVGGSVITFIRELYGFSNQRAIEYLIDKYAI